MLLSDRATFIAKGHFETSWRDIRTVVGSAVREVVGGLFSVHSWTCACLFYLLSCSVAMTHKSSLTSVVGAGLSGKNKDQWGLP